MLEVIRVRRVSRACAAVALAGVVGLAPGLFEPAMANRGGGGDPAPEAAADVSITQSVDLPLSIQADRVAQDSALTGVAPGDQLAYTVTVANAGPDGADNVSFTNTLPANTSLVDAVLPDGATCTDPVDGVITCQLGTMAASTDAEFVFTALISEATPAGTVLESTAEVSSTTADPNLANNTASTTASLRSSDLRVTKSASPLTVPAGDDVTYTITVTNGGPDAEPAVSLTDVLPTDTTPGTLPDGCTAQAGTVTCQLGSLDSGQSVNVDLVVSVAQNAPPGDLVNTATVAGLTAGTDPDLTNNSASATVTVEERVIEAGDEAPRLVPAVGDELVAGMELPRTGSRSVERQLFAALALIAAGAPLFVAARRRRPSSSNV